MLCKLKFYLTDWIDIYIYHLQTMESKYLILPLVNHLEIIKFYWKSEIFFHSNVDILCYLFQLSLEDLGFPIYILIDDYLILIVTLFIDRPDYFHLSVWDVRYFTITRNKGDIELLVIELVKRLLPGVLFLHDYCFLDILFQTRKQFGKISSVFKNDLGTDS